MPADAESLLPFRAAAIDKASAAANSGIVKQKIDMIGVEITRNGLGECQHLIFYRDIGEERRHARALPRLRQAKPLGFGHRLGKHIAERDVAAHSYQLKRQLTPHAGAASDNGNLSFKALRANLPSRSYFNYHTLRTAISRSTYQAFGSGLTRTPLPVSLR